MLDKNPSTRITLAEAMQHESVTREGACNPRWEGEEVRHTLRFVRVFTNQVDPWLMLS